jgi:hypothetical protein
MAFRFKLSLLVLLTAASTALATGHVYGPFFVRYFVDLGARGGDGSPMYQTFIPPGFTAPVPYEALVVAADYAGSGTCWKVAAIRTGSAEQKIWIESTPGTWVSLADDTVNTLDPGAYIYTEYANGTSLRVADYGAYAAGSQGRFFLTLTSHFYPAETRLATCDRFASSDGWPYVRISSTGAVTFVRRQGYP